MIHNSPGGHGFAPLNEKIVDRTQFFFFSERLPKDTCGKSELKYVLIWYCIRDKLLSLACYKDGVALCVSPLQSLWNCS